MDIAPLGFAVDTSGLERGARALDAVAGAGDRAAAATTKVTNAQLAEAKASKDAADQAAKVATAKLTLLRSTEGVTAAAIKEAKAQADVATAAQRAAGATLELAKAGEQATVASNQVNRTSAITSGILMGVAREAGSMATTMGIGSVGGRLGMTGAMQAAQQASSRLNPQLLMGAGIMGKVTLGAGTAAAAYIALSASLAENQDRWASYQQQLTNSLGNGNTAEKALYDVVNIANEVGVSVDTALQSFNRFARARSEIGATNEELILMTDTIMKLGRASGVEQGAMQGAMMQLSQALASGRLNGDELRSIMENMQPLAKAIADGLGVGIGELRRMGAEGELTGEKVFRSLLSQSGKANAEFEKMPKTVEQAKTRMSNQFDELAAHIGEKIGASAVIRTGINALTKPVEALNKALRDDAPVVHANNMQRMREEQEKTAKSTAKFLQEFNKEFNKDDNKGRELDKKRKEAAKALADAKKEFAEAEKFRERAGVLTYLNAENIGDLQALGGRGVAFKKAADKRIAKLGPAELKEWSEKARLANEKILQLTSGMAELDRQKAALERNDPFEKMTLEASDLEAALASASGGMVDMRLQAVAMARETKHSFEEIFALMQRLEGLKVEREVRGKEYAAGVQNNLAKALAGGTNKESAEISAEAATWAFEKFGDTVDANSDIVKRYTGALIEMRNAMRAVADATELASLKTQLEEVRSLTGLVASGGGGYAERQLQHQQSIARFQAERAGMPAGPGIMSGGGGGAISVAPGKANLPPAIVNFFKAKGLSDEQARGIAAGIMSESSGIHTNVNPTSGAYGLGQHLGARKQGLFNTFGKGGISWQEQLEYIWMELQGKDPTGEKGGRSVLSRGTASDTAAAYIRDFMRPGKDTNSGIARALRHLGGGVVGGAMAGATGTMQPGVDYTGDIVGARNTLFDEQERLNTTRFLAGSKQAWEDTSARANATRYGPEALRAMELDLKVQQAIRDNHPDMAEAVERAVREADAAERRLEAETQIWQMKHANDNQERRIGAMGSPAAMRQLELQLRIEEIKRSQPVGRQGALIDEAKRDDSLKQAESIKRRSVEMDNQRRALQDQVDLIGMVGDEERIAAKLQQERVFLYSIGSDLSGQELANHMAMVEAMERGNIALERQLERWRFIRETSQQTAEDIGKAFSTAFGEAMRTGEVNWKGFVSSIEEAFLSALDRMVQQLVISPIITLLSNFMTQGLNALMGGSMGAAPAGSPLTSGSFVDFTGANGAVFNKQGIVPFAGGDIFSSPTRFMFGGGRTGLAGEGPGSGEALMPLRRGADGKLGVAASGGGGGGSNTNVNVYDMRSAGSSEAVEIEERETGDGMRQINVMVRDSVKGHMNKGTFDSTQRAAYGNKRTVARR